MQRLSLLRAGIGLLSLNLLGGGVSARAQAPAPVSLNHRNAMYSLPAVVRVFGGWEAKFIYRGKEYDVKEWGSGSGFFVQPSGYIVTNAHCVLSVSHGSDEEQKNKNELWDAFVEQVEIRENYGKGALSGNAAAKAQLAKLTEQKYTPIQRVQISNGQELPYEIKKIGEEAGVGSNKDVAVLKVEIHDAPCLRLGDSDAVQVMDHVLVVGYPAAAEASKHMDDRSLLVASVTDGVVSAVKSSPVGAPILQVSAPATHGNSGGPIINDRGEVIGILTFGGNRVYNQEVTGFAFAVTAGTIQEFINETGMKIEPSATEELYRKGLDRMWAGDYAQARSYFYEAKGLFPQHSEVDRLINLCSHNITQPGGFNPAQLAGQNKTGDKARPAGGDKAAQTNSKTTSTGKKK